MPQNKQNSEVVAKKRCSNVECHRINKIVKEWPKKDVVVMLNAHYYNTFFWSLLHYFVYSVPFNITTIPFLATA
jgi:hypothetical protein